MNKRISGYRQSETMQGTLSARTPESPVLQCLLFLGVFLVAMLVESAPPTMLAFPYMMAQLLISHVDLSDSAAVMAALPSVTLDGVCGSIAFDEVGDAVRDSAFIKTANTAENTWEFVAVQTIGE